MNRLFGAAFAAILACVIPTWGSSVLPIPLERRLEVADAVFRGEVVKTRAFRRNTTGPILTETIFRVLEIYKGRVPDAVSLVHRGGFLNGVGEKDDFAPVFHPGEQRLMLVKRQRDGTLGLTFGASDAMLLATAAQPLSATERTDAGEAACWLEVLRQKTSTGGVLGVDLTDVAVRAEELVHEPHKLGAGPRLNSLSSATNLFQDVNGIPARYLAPDRGEPIPYYVDADFLPVGMTQVQALKAVSDALQAWSKVTSLKFAFAGMRSFGVPSADVQASDAALRIQLHDAYQFVTGAGEVLGRGGIRWTAPVEALAAGWTTGGNVAGNDFNMGVAGWVVLQHNSPFMRDLANFTEVLCHELGHALCISHSSNDPAESNPLLKQAVMYYMAHGDGRGAALNGFDTNVVQQIYPVLNTPPFCFDRFIEAITTPTNKPGLNRIGFAGYDLQTTNLTIATTEPTSNTGSFSVSGQSIQFDANAFYNSPRLDPESGFYYDLIYARASDGTNASPYAVIRVIALQPDTYYEGIPDQWRLTYFGSKNPTAGPNRRANDDFDRDGFTNLQESHLGADPTDPASNLRLLEPGPGSLEWSVKPYEVYELQSTTDFHAWTLAKVVAPTNAVATVSVSTTNAHQFFRVLKVP